MGDSESDDRPMTMCRAFFLSVEGRGRPPHGAFWQWMRVVDAYERMFGEELVFRTSDGTII